ncbi:hypothetical protein RD055328_00130 [Companilactobacillus sp. RD055328]|uniref:hypothetical protein n=1 Tax=Companilactobacillus sp. RD055328 TaxID=2916634 RepID=UPI001FC7E19D|nr:hypothetical protein [Companilactobacillus sp. RD055328]GKQ42090.1 hypothetical protein RD055328_00130 [Companilactobacillus sp. RD055328]
MSKKSGFLFGLVLGTASAYGITKYVMPMSSKEDIIEKLNEVKDQVTGSVENFDKEQMISNFNEKTADLKTNIDSQVNKHLASSNNFENIVIDEEILEED